MVPSASPAIASTPPDRDRFADLVRAGSIVAVVVGHWLVAGISWNGTVLEETSTLGRVPAMWPLTWLLQVIPLFFFVAGAVNGRGWERARARGEGFVGFMGRRMRRVLVPTSVFLGALTCLTVGYRLAGARWLGGAAPLPTQPLWFLGVYLVIVALTPATAAAHRRWGWRVFPALAAGVVAADVGRVGFDLEWAGYVNVLTVWALVYQIGYVHGDGRLTPVRASAMAICGLLGAAVLVAVFPYPARMVGVAGDRIANMHPPTAALACLGIGQIGTVVLLKPRFAALLERPRIWAGVVRVNLAIMTLYLWHQVALIVVGRVLLPAGYPDPVPAGIDWWVARSGLIAVAGAVLVGVIVLVGASERIPPSIPVRGTGRGTAATLGAIALAALGLLGLAGTRFVDLLEPQVALGLRVPPIVALAMVGAASAIVHATRSGEAGIARVAVLAAGGLGLIAAGYATGVVVPRSHAAAWLAAGVASVPLGLAMVSGVLRSSDPPG